MKNKLAKRLVVAAILTSWVVSPVSTVFAADAHLDITSNGGAINGASGINYNGSNGGAANISGVQDITISGFYQGNSAISQGGAISLYGGASAIITEGSKFIENHANTAGAISSVGSNLVIGDDVEFSGNYSETYAGAILNQDSNLTIGNNVIFRNNISNKNSGSDSGAALAIDDHNIATSNTSISVGNNALFENNQSGKSGAGVYIYESAGKINFKIGSGSIFSGNKATVNGGAMSVYGASGTSADGSNTGVTIGANATFSGNHAGKFGGAIYAQNWNGSGTKLSIADGAVFRSNTAVSDGGAIYNACTAEINNATFIQNSTELWDGGAIHSTGSDAVMTIKGSTFTANSAGDWAGAIGSYKGATLSISDSIFMDNIANKTGGAVVNGKGSALTIDGAKFTNNHALHGDGGAIGNYGSLELNNVVFEGNTAQLLKDSNGNYEVAYDADIEPVGGGALSLGAVSASKIATIANTIFKNNKSGRNGGAIGTRLAANASNVDAKLDISAKFEGNEAYENGGAIYNTFYANNGLNKGEGVTVVGEFINNHAGQNGGAIYNDNRPDWASNAGGVMTILGGSKFDGNSADGLGGAIYNTGKMYLDTANGDITFTNNTDSTGKNDIFMADGSELTLLGSQNVTIGSGLDSENSNATITNNGVNFIFADNAVNSYSGKYEHISGTLVFGANVSTFENYEMSPDTGAELIIDESATLTSDLVVNGKDTAPVTNLANIQFNGEITPSTGSITDALQTGHFSYNGTDVDINGAGLTLSNNTIIDEANILINGTEAGGVRYLGFGDGSGTTGDITLGDNAGLQYKDGAYINGDSTLTMGNGASLIFNNDSSTIDYDVTIATTGSGANIVMNGSGSTNISSDLDGINIQSNSGVLNLTKDSLNVGDLTVKGENTTLNLFGDVTGGDAIVNKATLGVFGNSELGSLALGSTLAMQNGVINNLNVGTFSLNADSNFTFDVDPRSGLTDTINAETFTNAGDSNLLVTGISMIQAPTSGSFNIDLSNVLTAENGDTTGVIKVEDSIIANTQMGRYLISSAGSGNPVLTASLMSINPQMYRGQVATLASWQNQLVVNNMLFDHMAVLGRQLMDDAKTANLKAAAYPQFAPYQYSVKDGSLWYKAYGNFERLSMTKGLSVGNNAYGSLIGADFPLVDLKNGWKLVPTAYVGYNGAHQHFGGVSMYQNGAQLGLMGTAYKNDFLTSLLAYAGGYGNDMTVKGSFGNASDTTGNWFAGVASKSAYNFHIAKDLIFQPTAMVAYNAFGGQNWGSNFGTMSMSTGMLNGLNMAPGFNLILNKKSFSLYATAQMVYNLMGGVDGTAGNVDLGYVRMRHSYFEYGLGVMKQFKDRFNGYLQFTIRNGGRTGIGFQGGIQIKVGK